MTNKSITIDTVFAKHDGYINQGGCAFTPESCIKFPEDVVIRKEYGGAIVGNGKIIREGDDFRLNAVITDQSVIDMIQKGTLYPCSYGSGWIDENNEVKQYTLQEVFLSSENIDDRIEKIKIIEDSE